MLLCERSVHPRFLCLRVYRNAGRYNWLAASQKMKRHCVCIDLLKALAFDQAKRASSGEGNPFEKSISHAARPHAYSILQTYQRNEPHRCAIACLLPPCEEVLRFDFARCTIDKQNNKETSRHSQLSRLLQFVQFVQFCYQGINNDAFRTAVSVPVSSVHVLVLVPLRMLARSLAQFLAIPSRGQSLAHPCC